MGNLRSPGPSAKDPQAFPDASELHAYGFKAELQRAEDREALTRELREALVERGLSVDSLVRQ